MADRILPEFQDSLLSRSLAPAKNVPFYAYWVSHHMSEKSIQNAVKEAVRKSGIVKHASVHTLRHSFAPHLLMNGVNIREIQTLLGHKHVETTMVYTHVVRDLVSVPRSPLDSLYV